MEEVAWSLRDVLTWWEGGRISEPRLLVVAVRQQLTDFWSL